MKRVPLTHGSARVDNDCSQETINALNKMSELIYNMDELHTIEVGEQYQHKNGNVYTVLFLTNTGGDEKRQKMHPVQVVYQGVNGKKWSRGALTWHNSMTLLEKDEDGTVWCPCDEPNLVSNRLHGEKGSAYCLKCGNHWYN